MPELKRVNVGGQTVLVEVEHDPGHRNPPLQNLNQAYRAEDAEHQEARDETWEALERARKTQFDRNGKRIQKPLAPHMLPKKAS